MEGMSERNDRSPSISLFSCAEICRSISKAHNHVSGISLAVLPHSSTRTTRAPSCFEAVVRVLNFKLVMRWRLARNRSFGWVLPVLCASSPLLKQRAKQSPSPRLSSPLLASFLGLLFSRFWRAIRHSLAPLLTHSLSHSPLSPSCKSRG